MLVYANDIAIIGDSIEIVKMQCKKLMSAGSKVGAIINNEMTEYMKHNRRDRTYRHK